MGEKEKLLKLCGERYSKKDFDVISKSISFVEDNLKGEKKFSKKSFAEFNFGVGEILVMSGLSYEIVVSGILYGVEKVFSFEKIAFEFGEEIAGIVFGQLQLRTIRKKNASVNADLVRKILLTGLEDVRVVFVKLAVKLANLRIISALKEGEQKKIAKDILEIYVPLAMRLGLDYIRNNLDELAFKTIHPRQYEQISNFFKESRKEREEFIENFRIELKKLLGQKVGLLKIKGRDKQIRSIFEKIVDRGTPLEKQKDHYAIRIIVDSEGDCYSVLGILHEKYIPVAGRLKDYINSPKSNGYQSLHTVLKIPNSGEEIEVQIRTEKMDEEAEEGIAAHWNYKKVSGDSSFEKKVGWLRVLMESQKSSTDKEFMRNLKIDLFADKIYCYTPKGDVRELSKNATLLDFAYSIHQEVGERAVGGRIDGKFVSLKEPLKNGVVVEILTNKNQRPRRDWLKFVVSARAKAKIRKGIKRYESIPVPKRQSVKVVDEEDFDSLVESPEFPRGEFSFAKCCYPLPKDELLGISKTRKKILVHKMDCKKLSSGLSSKNGLASPKNVVPVSWKESFNRPLNLKVLSGDRSGILADLLNTISRGGFVVRGANAKIVGNGEVECDFVVIPKVLDEVERMVGRVGKVRGVMRVWFE
jgi:GTP pyrophosphokinase